MASPAQITANQINAQSSTGPRSDAGKSITRKNSSRHGLCSSLRAINLEESEPLQILLADLTVEHQPVGTTEEILVYKMAEQFALANRASTYLAYHTEVNQCSDDSKQVALFIRYYTTFDRAFTRSLNELRKLQQERRRQEAGAEIGSVPQNLKAPASPTKKSPKKRPQSIRNPENPAPAVPEVNNIDVAAINKAVAAHFQSRKWAA